MTTKEIVVIIGCLFLGYWLANKYLDKSGSTTFKWKGFQGNTEANNSSSKTSEDEYSNEYIQQHWFTILGISRDASPDQIAFAYKQKISQYHPDKVDKLGPEFRELAEKKAKQINAAYKYGRM
jgi:DnaJ-domain-containing protein 1